MSQGTRVQPGAPIDSLGWSLKYGLDCHHDYLFTTSRGNRIYGNRPQLTRAKALKREGITRDNITMDVLRHSLATLLLKPGEVALVSLPHLSDHSRSDTTAICLHIADEQTREAVDARSLARR
jgi:site-specific recombinase XerD